MGHTPTVCPTVLAGSIAEYRKQLGEVQGFATRLHVDYMDGLFAPTRSIRLEQSWWQPGPKVDLHVMYKHPLKVLEAVVALQPHLVIIHAEAEGVLDFLKQAHGLGLKLGVALLPETKPKVVEPYLDLIDHALVFSGNLGHYGGKADISLLEKAWTLKKLKPSLEIGWDGGINDKNIHELAAGGIDVLNVGGYIHHAENPENAYDTLVSRITD